MDYRLSITGNLSEIYLKAMVMGRSLLLCTRVREMPASVRGGYGPDS